MRTRHAPVVGRVDSWDDDAGWGVLRTPEGLSVFCHYSSVDAPGYRALAAGTEIRFDYEVPGQDGCDARVATGARPTALDDPDVPLGQMFPMPVIPSWAIDSSLTLTFDPPRSD